MAFDFNKLTNRPSMPTKIMLTIRLIVGGYLIYLAYDIRESVFSPDGNIVFIIAAIIFIVCGGIIVAFSARDLLTGRYLGGPLDTSEQEETTSTSDVDETASISDTGETNSGDQTN